MESNEHSLSVILRIVASLLMCAPPKAGNHLRQFGPLQDQEHEISGKTMTVGNPQNPDDLPKELVDAYAQGGRKIVIRSGVYLFSQRDHPIIVLDSWKRARISGHGVTLVSSETAKPNAMFRLVNCSDVQMVELTLSQTEQVAYQGKVSDVSTEAGGRTTCTWIPDDGYPAPPENATKMQEGPNIVDGLTRKLKLGCGDEWDASLLSVGNRKYRVTFPKNPHLANGDFLVARHGDSPKKVHLVNCHDCILDELTLLRNGFAAIREEDGGGNAFYECHWQLGPKPDGATEKPLVTSSADGIHSTGAYPGPDIENCDFSGILLDDCIAIHGYYQKVRNSQGSSVTLDDGHAGIAAGQPIRISAVGFFEDAFVNSVTRNADGSMTVVLDKSVDAPAGARADNPLMNGQSFKILNCKIGGTRSRGILAKADGGLIEKNTIIGCAGPAVNAGPEYYWEEGDYVRDLTVRSNTISENGFSPGQIAAVLIKGEGAKGNHNVTIENNQFDSNYGGDIFIDWTSVAIIKSNIFLSPPQSTANLPNPVLINLHHCNSIKIWSNLVKRSSLYAMPWVQQSPTTTDVDQQNGTGLHTAK